MNFYVYCIKDKDEVLYVGGSCNPKTRFKAHKITTLSDYKRKKRLVIEVIETCCKENISERELYWIRYYKEIGKAQYNKSMVGHNGNGGGGQQFEAIKVKAYQMERIRQYKKKTGIPISAFVEMAIMEELSKLSKTKKQ